MPTPQENAIYAKVGCTRTEAGSCLSIPRFRPLLRVIRAFKDQHREILAEKNFPA